MAAAAAAATASYLVTGANKGIGLAITKALLKHNGGATRVFLGSRNVERGNAAKESLEEEQQTRCTVVQLDVTDADSIAKAAETVKEELGEEGHLQGLINNAGGASGMGWSTAADADKTFALNVMGIANTTKAFIPLINPEGGRVVNISSGAAPMFVEKCSAEQQAKLVNPKVTFEEITGFLGAFRKIGATAEAAEGATPESINAAFAAAGLAPSTYGASKTAVNLLTMFLARTYPKLKINACSPGFIATDLTKPFESADRSLADMGALPTERGAVCPMFLTVGEVPTPPGRGYYYGSDAKRSPLDKSRSPGTPVYEAGPDDY